MEKKEIRRERIRTRFAHRQIDYHFRPAMRFSFSLTAEHLRASVLSSERSRVLTEHAQALGGHIDFRSPVGCCGKGEAGCMKPTSILMRRLVCVESMDSTPKSRSLLFGTVLGYLDLCVDAIGVVCHQLGLLGTGLHAVVCGGFVETLN